MDLNKEKPKTARSDYRNESNKIKANEVKTVTINLEEYDEVKPFEKVAISPMGRKLYESTMFKVSH